jgi:hypothetical protein
MPVNMTIWSYWETRAGSYRPKYLDLCEDTWRRHCGDDFEIIRLSPENVLEYAPHVINEWRRIPLLSQKADYLRAAVLYQQGGIWLDNDTIVLRNLKEMTDRLEASGSDFIGCGRTGNRPSSGVFGAKRGSILVGNWLRSMETLLKSRSESLKFGWSELVYGTLWPLTRTYAYHQYDFRICIPVHPSRFQVFFADVTLEQVSRQDCDIRADTLAVSLYNAMFPGWFKKLSREQVFEGRMLISRLFRVALERSSDGVGL